MADVFDFYVRDNRKINFEIAEPIMREDSGVTDFRFHIPKILNGLEVSDWSWWFVFVNAKKEKYSVALTLSDDPESPLEFNIATYTVDYAMSIKAGSVQFALEAINAGTGGAIDNEWHTYTYETKVKETLQGNQAEYAETESDIISALIQQIQQKYNQLVGGATPEPKNLVADMTDQKKVYLYVGSEDGESTNYWYYHNGTRFVPGGLYASGITVDTVPTQGSTNAVSSGGVYSVTSALDADVVKIYGDTYRVENFKWSNIASSASNYGFKKGYYSKTDGTYTSSPNFICSNSEISLVGVKRVVLIPPSGMCISAGAFKADNTFTIFGEANSKYYADYIDKPLEFDANDYVRCYVSVGNYEDQTPTATDVIADSTYINSIKMYLYFDKYTDDIVTIGREIELLSESKTIENLFKQGGYGRNGNAFGISSSYYPVSIVTTNYISDNIARVKTSNNYYMTLFAWSESDDSWVGFLCDENRITDNRYANVYWTQDLRIERFRKLYPNTKFRIEIETAETIAGTMTAITPLAAVNAIAYVLSKDIQDHYKTEMATTIASVRNAITEPALVFPFVTDIHYDSVNHFFDDCIDNIKTFSKNIKCDFAMNGGDNTDGNTSPEITLSRDFYMLNRFMEINVPYFHAIGNHDINGYSSTTRLTSSQIYQAYLSNTRNVHFNMTAGEKDYYIDFDAIGVRLIVLDSNHNATYTFSVNTGTWLANTALDTDKIVIVVTHMSPINSQNWSNHSMANSASIVSALQAFVNGGGTVIQLCGHSHADYHFETPWLSVHTCCQKFIQEDSSDTNYDWIRANTDDLTFPQRTIGTYTEDCWDVVVVKPISRTISFIRFGAGNDRTFSF